MAHVTNLGFSMADLDAAVSDGSVRRQVHPEFEDLYIYNYTEETQYRNRWNKITLACRGLILNVATGEIVARPWEKFFNFGQMDNRIDAMAPVEVTDKMDGSLGILYPRPDGKLAIATRGSFASEQAIHATQVFQERYSHNVYLPATNSHTLLFEIIYPENRIVVNYDDMDDLVILGAVNKKYGFYHGPLEAQGLLDWTGPVTEVFHADNFVSALSLPDRKGMEGYVIRSGRNIVKLKQADYVELHRIVTNLSPKTIWERLSSGYSIASVCASIPDEFHAYVEEIGTELLKQHAAIFYSTKVRYQLAFNTVVAKSAEPSDGRPSRRAFAEEFKKYKEPGLLFAMLDGKDISNKIWMMIKPRGDAKSLIKDEV